MTIVFDHENRLFSADRVNLFPADKSLFLNRIRRCAESDHDLFLASALKLSYSLKDLFIRAAFHDIETCMKLGKRSKMLMCIAKRRDQGFISELNSIHSGKFLRKLFSHKYYSAAIFNEKSCDIVVLVNC